MRSLSGALRPPLAYPTRHPLAAQAGQPFPAEGDDLIADAQLKQAVERAVADEVHDRAGGQAERPPAPEPFGAVVLDLADQDALAGAAVGQGAQLAAGDDALGGRDGVAVRVFERFAEV